MPTAQRPRTTPRKKPRQERSQATVDAILDATARVLVQTGYDRASTNRVAAAAGVSIGSLYQYFPSKEAVVAALLERHSEQMSSLIRGKMLEVTGAPVAVAVREMVRAMLDAHLVDPKLHKVLMEQVPRTRRVEKIMHVEREMEILVRAHLEAHARELRPGLDLDTAAFMLVTAVEGVTHAAVLHDRGGDVAIDALARALTDLVLRFLVP